MSKNYKPRPENRREFLNKLVDPYLPEVGNPNSVFSEPVKPGQPEFNRAYEISQKNDTDINVAIGIKDIDSAVLYYFENVIKPSVTQNNTRINVPIVYGSPERWKAVQADGFYRDVSGKIQVPLIMFKRDSIERNRDLGNKLDGNKVSNLVLVQKRFSRRNIYDNFTALTNRQPEKEFVVAFPPDYITLTYSCTIFTDYVEQMDKLVEAINFASDSYWGDPSKFQFRARIDSYTTQTLLEQGQDRAIKSNFNIVLNGYIIPDSINRELASVNRAFSTAQVVFGIETAGSTEQFTANLAKPVRKTVAGVAASDSINITVNQSISNVATGDIGYINTNKTEKADTITTNTVIFVGATILQPPAGSTLPITTVNNFTFYINGQYVPSSLVSLVEGGGNTTATFDVTGLGYSLEADDEVIAIGKWQ